MSNNKKPLTEEQIIEIQNNKYTHSVTEYVITFTLEFKEFFIEQRKIPGMTTRKIFEKAGYDTSYLSKTRLDSYRQRILDEYNSPTGLKPPRGLSSSERIAAFEKKDLTKQKQEASILELQKEIVYLQKQVEFLKKIIR